MVGSFHFVINENNTIISLKQYPITNEEIYLTSIFQNPLSHPTTLLRKEVFELEKYVTKYKFVEDYCLWSRLTKQVKFANIPEYLTYYRIHKNNSSKVNNYIQHESVSQLLVKELKKIGINPSIEELKTHLAINQNLGPIYFNSQNKITILKNWVERVLNAKTNDLKITSQKKDEVKDFIFSNFCIKTILNSNTQIVN